VFIVGKFGARREKVEIQKGENALSLMMQGFLQEIC
jgi:hypothetical protein